MAMEQRTACSNAIAQLLFLTHEQGSELKYQAGLREDFKLKAACKRHGLAISWLLVPKANSNQPVGALISGRYERLVSFFERVLAERAPICLIRQNDSASWWLHDCSPGLDSTRAEIGAFSLGKIDTLVSVLLGQREIFGDIDSTSKDGESNFLGSLKISADPGFFESWRRSLKSGST